MAALSNTISKSKKGGLISTVGSIGGGFLGGIILNDAWEGALTGGKPFPGYGQVLFPLIPATSGKPAVNFGVDDALQSGLSVAVAIAGAVTKNAILRNIGIGLTLGWAATKLGETLPGVQTTDNQGTYFHNPISIIPHRYPTVTAAAGAFDMGTILPSNVNPSNYPVSAYYFNVA